MERKGGRVNRQVDNQPLSAVACVVNTVGFVLCGGCRYCCHWRQRVGVHRFDVRAMLDFYREYDPRTAPPLTEEEEDLEEKIAFESYKDIIENVRDGGMCATCP